MSKVDLALVKRVKAIETLQQFFDADNNVNLENADLMAFYRAAIHRGCAWVTSKGRMITDDICENGRFYKDGWVIFDHQSPKIWSFKNINDVVKFLNDRPIVAEDL